MFKMRGNTIVVSMQQVENKQTETFINIVGPKLDLILSETDL